MARTELTAHTRLPMRDHRKPESRNKDAFLQQHVTHPDCRCGLADDDRDDRRFPFKWPEARFDYLFTEVQRVIPQLVHAVRVCDEETDRFERARCYRRRERIGEELRPRALSQHVAQRSRPCDESSRSTS